MKMQFDLRQLGRTTRGASLREEHVDRTFDPSAFATSEAASEEYQVTAPVHLVMDIHKDGTAYRVTGRVTARLQLECGRCLEPFEIPVDSAFELRYVPQVENTGDGEREVALKVLKTKRADSEPYLRFRNEIGVLRRFEEDPGVLPILADGATYAAIVVLGHAVMCLIAGPASKESNVSPVS